MHFALAANSIVGVIFSKKKEAKYVAGQGAGVPRDTKSYKRQISEGYQGKRDPNEEDRKRSIKHHDKRDGN